MPCSSKPITKRGSYGKDDMAICVKVSLPPVISTERIMEAIRGFHGALMMQDGLIFYSIR